MSDTLKMAGLLLVLAVAAQGSQRPEQPRMDADERGSYVKLVAQANVPQKPASSKPPAPKPNSTAQQTPGNNASTPKPGASGTLGQTDATPKNPAATAKKDSTATWKKFCAPEGDYCVKYPPTWQTLGDTADTGGIVVAPQQADKPAEKWSSITAAATDLPPQPANKERPSFDELIGVVLDSMSPGVHPQTLERKQLTIEDMPAQLLKLRYEDESGQPWIEEIALMDDEDVIYSLTLKCTPQELATLEPTFNEMLGSWKLVEPQE